MGKKFDVIIIGSGPGGSTAANKLAKKGKHVAVIDKLFGGTCALKGCTPKKAMESVSNIYWEQKDLEGKGFVPTDRFLNWHELLTHQKHFTELVPREAIKKLEEAGVTCIKGNATFTGKKSVQVKGEEYQAKKIILATGATEVKLPFKGADLLKTSFDFFRLPNLPKRITFIGGGYIAFELSHIAASCGSEVTIINDTNHFLKNFDQDFANRMLHATLSKGIDVRLNCTIKSISHNENYCIKYEVNGEQDIKELTSDVVFHSAGRIPALDELNIEKAGLSKNKNGGLATDRYLQAKENTSVYGLGDVLGNLPFTEIANYEAEIVVNNTLHPSKLKYPTYKGTPSVLYCHPKMASIGKTEKELKEKGRDIIIYEGSMNGFLPQRTANNSIAHYKIITDTKDKIISANLIGLRADEMINMIAFAIQTNTTFKKLKKLLLAYPSATRDIKSFH